MWSRPGSGWKSPKPGYAESGGTTMSLGSSAVTRDGAPSPKLSTRSAPASTRARSRALASCLTKEFGSDRMHKSGSVA